MTDIEKIRLRIGDKSLPQQFSDDELQSFLTDEGSVNLACAAALESWAAAYATNADTEHIGDYSYNQSIVDKMTKLAEKLRQNEMNIPKMDIASMDLTGGSAITEEND